MGDIYSDAAVLRQASDAVDALLGKDPLLELPEHALLRQRLSDAAAKGVDFRSI